MKTSEILDTLFNCTDFTPEKEIGTIYTAFIKDCQNELYIDFYTKKKRILESLPWNIVQNPRNPQPEEYPSENGDYITMLDCNEHMVLLNTFKDCNFGMFNRTHVKWWMKVLEQN